MEEAALFNPAFLSLLIRQMTVGYDTVAGAGLPLVLAYIGAPLVLHKGTREILPATRRTDLLEWLSKHPETRLLTPPRARRVAPYLREALLFGLVHKILFLGGDVIEVGSKPVGQSGLRSLGGDASVCLDRARHVGRWMASSGPVTYQLSVWRVVP
jgi:Family of unknown function (DUF6521)